MPFQILSLSGGGYLGLYTVAVLAEIEERIKAPLASRFDLIAGTSVGGIIAIGIANEVPATELKKAFEDSGTAIFSDRRAPRTSVGKFYDVLRSAFKPNTIRALSEKRSSTSSVPRPPSVISSIPASSQLSA